MSLTLSIAIPTYNRPERVVERIKELLPQVQNRNDIEVLIIDNASDHNVRDYVLNEFDALSSNIIFHRNVANVGLCANICKCYELSQGEWIWTLGDDDTICDDAINSILSNIDDQASFLCLSTSIHKHSNKTIVSCLSDFWEITQEPSAFSNALFISSCVYKNSVCKKYLRTAYQKTFSAAPHIAIVLDALKQGHKVVYSTHICVKHNAAPPSNSWNYIDVYSGIPVLAEMSGDQFTQRKLSSSLSLFAPGIHIKGGIKLMLSDTARGTGFYYIYYSRLTPCLSGKNALKAMLLRELAGLLFRIPQIDVIAKACLRMYGIRSETYYGNSERL